MNIWFYIQIYTSIYTLLSIIIYLNSFEYIIYVEIERAFALCNSRK